MNIETAYLYRRYYSAGATYPRKAPNPAIEAIKAARLDVANGVSRHLPYKPSLNWQKAEPGFAYIEKPEAFGLRHVGNVATEPGYRNGYFTDAHCNGWYCDNYEGETCFGVVYQLPARDGKARFVAGYQFANGDSGPTLNLHNIFEGELGDNCSYERAQGNPASREAALCADSMAQHIAEKEREYQTAWEAGNYYADLKSKIADSKQIIRDLLADRRKAKLAGIIHYSAICNTIKNAVSDALGDIADSRKKMEKLANGDYQTRHIYFGFYTGDKRLRAAFNEGAGENILA